MRLFSVLTLTGLLTGASALSAAGPVDPEIANQGTSLTFSGGWEAAPEGNFTLTREELAAIPGVKTVRETMIGQSEPADVTVLPLQDFLKAYPPLNPEAGLVLECLDKWESFLPPEFIEEHNPYLLLYYNGDPPGMGTWPMFGGDIEAMAPFYVYVSKFETPGFVYDTKYGMVSATQMSGIRLETEEERYAPFYAGKNGELSEIAQTGRALFLRRCNTCHQGPGGVGGNVSARPFQILQAHAKFNPGYFRSTVANPKAVFPETIMPKHEDFGPAEFEALIAFLSQADPQP
ncbi:MAG: c-type cytochrome [Opitutales bacterium]